MVTAMSWLTTTGSIVGVVGGIAGPWIAIVARRDSRDSAEASRDSANEAAKVSRIENQRQHEAFRPELPNEIEAQKRDASLFGSITVDRDYRIAATGLYDESSSHEIGMPLLIRAGQPQSFQIDHLPPGAKEPRTKAILFRFWPPVADVDGVEPWACPCGQPATENVNGKGHWERRVPVHYYDALDSVY